jgi:plastocyanin
MRHRLRQGISARGVRVAAGATVVGAMVGCMGVAAAAQQAATVPVAVVDTAFEPATVSIATGDTVTWNFDSVVVHNVESQSGAPEDAVWAAVDSPLATSGQFSHTFNWPGTYTYLCKVHPTQMTGTITVTGPPVTPTPTPSPTTTPEPSPSPSPTPAATPAASGGGSSTLPATDHRATPAPAGSARADATSPALTAVRVRGVRRGARVSFRLSEPATVTLRVETRKSGRALRTVRLAAREGTRTVTVRGKSLKRGRYAVELQARDATGNTSPLERASVRIGR